MNNAPVLDSAALASYQGRAAKRFIGSSSEGESIVIAGAFACTLLGADGRVYLDLISGASYANVGHRHPAVVEALTEQIAVYIHSDLDGRLVLPVQVDLIYELVKIVGEAYSLAIFSESSSESLAVAKLMAKETTNRSKTAIVEGIENVESRLTQIDEGTAAAILVCGSSDQGSHNMRTLQKLRERCSHVGAVLILDGRFSGIGHSGNWFAYEQSTIDPDLIILPNSFGSGLPMGILMARTAMFQSVPASMPKRNLAAGSSSLACAASLALLRVVEGDHLLERARTNGQYLLERMRSIVAQFPQYLGDIRGDGLYTTFDFKGEGAGIVSAMQERGVLVRLSRNSTSTICVIPPLVITPAEIDVFIGVLRAVLAELSGDVGRNEDASHRH